MHCMDLFLSLCTSLSLSCFCHSSSIVYFPFSLHDLWSPRNAKAGRNVWTEKTRKHEKKKLENESLKSECDCWGNDNVEWHAMTHFISQHFFFIRLFVCFSLDSAIFRLLSHSHILTAMENGILIQPNRWINPFIFEPNGICFPTANSRKICVSSPSIIITIHDSKRLPGDTQTQRHTHTLIVANDISWYGYNPLIIGWFFGTRLKEKKHVLTHKLDEKQSGRTVQ